MKKTRNIKNKIISKITWYTLEIQLKQEMCLVRKAAETGSDKISLGEHSRFMTPP